MADGYIKIDTKILGEGFEKDLSRIKKGLVALTASMSAFGLKTISVGAKFEKSMSQVAATMGMTVDEIRSGTGAYKDLENAAREAGANTEWSASQAAEALNYMALAGYNAEQSIDTLPTVLNLATAGGLELANASDMITDAMSALGLELKNVGDFSDVLVRASQKSNTSVAQLGEAILTVGGTARVLKGGVVEMSSALGVLANNGIKGAEGGTALRNVINSLSAPSATAAKELQKLGINAFDSAGNMRSLQDIFKDFNVVFEDLTQQEKQQALSNIFNVRDLKSVQALMKATNGELTALEEELSQAKGTAEETSRVMQDNLAGSLKTLNSKFEELSITIFKENSIVKDAVDSLAQFIGEFAQTEDVKNFSRAIGEILTLLKDLVVAVLPYAVKLFSMLVDVLSFVAKNAKGVIIAFASYKAMMIANTLATIGFATAWKTLRTVLIKSGIGALIVGIGVAINYVIDNWETLKVRCKIACEQMTYYWNKFTDFVAKCGLSIAKQVKNIFTLGFGDTSEYDKAMDDLDKKALEREKKHAEELARLREEKKVAKKKDKGIPDMPETENVDTSKIDEELNKAVKGMDSFKTEANSTKVSVENLNNEVGKGSFENMENEINKAEESLKNFKDDIIKQKGKFNPLELNPEELKQYEELSTKLENVKEKYQDVIEVQQEQPQEKTAFERINDEVRVAEQALNEFKSNMANKYGEFSPFKLDDEELDRYRQLYDLLDKNEKKLESIQTQSIEFMQGVTFNSAEIKNSLSSITDGFEELGEAIVNGEASFGILAKAGLNAIGSLINALAEQVMGQAIAALLNKDYAGFGIGMAKAAALKVAGGMIKANAGRFEKGGIVGGNSYSGDKLTANVNSGELILNMAQQENLASMLLAKANTQPMVNIEVINNTNSQVGVQQDDFNRIKIIIDTEITQYMTGSKGEKMLSTNYGIKKVGLR